MPLATTLKVAEAPAFTVRLAGWVTTAGSTFTVSTAALLVTLPTALLTTTV